jgi:regulator of sirC expression with transglutaminase-like and TPR domain
VQGLVRALTELFRVLEKMPTISIDLLSAQLYVLDRIIGLQPSETSRWAERAMLNTRRGDRSGALDDLKRFFAFHERETAPAAIVSLFDDLRGQ